MKITLNDIITLLSALGIAGSVLTIIATAGAVDCNNITMTKAAIISGICLVVLALSIFGLIKMEKKEEESVYDRL